MTALGDRHYQRIACQRYSTLIPELIRDETWIKSACDRAMAIYSNQGIHQAATLLASTHPYAVDYLTQAPVLALAASHGSPLRRHSERLQVAKSFGGLCERGGKLKDILRAYYMPLPMRAIAGYAICPKRHKILTYLAKVPPSILAQSIPPEPGAQNSWLQALHAWADTMNRRHAGPQKLFAWAAFALRTVAHREVRGVSDLADFAGQNWQTFNTNWTRENAEAAAERWHLELAKKQDASTFIEEHGIGFDDPIDYTPFPDSASVNGFEVIALRSGGDIFCEGVAMHHCVRSYTRQVIIGQSRLFSVRADGRRVATVELANVGGKYRAVQIKGPCNSRPTVKVGAAIDQYLENIRAARRARASAETRA